MDYLKDFGFTVEEIKYLCDELDEEDVHELIIHENRVINILKYLKSEFLKIISLFVCFTLMILPLIMPM